LAEGWTVLSPAEFTGVAFIFLTILERRFLGVLATFRLPIAVVLALGTLLTGARAQLLLAIGIAGAIRLARLYRTQLTGILATIAIALISILAACLVIFTDVNIPHFRASDRFTTESMGQGFEVRLGFIRESLTLDSPVFGNGVGAWSYMHNRVDVKPGQKEGLTLYPHNSLAEVYFEFGTVGLLLFCWILYIGARNARFLSVRYNDEPELRSLAAAITAYFIYSFLLSLKQSTFLAAIGLYLSISMLCVLIQMNRTETQNNASTKDPIPSD
jgi:O-antigen ligase